MTDTTYSLDTVVRDIAGWRRLDVMAEGSWSTEAEPVFTGITLHHWNGTQVDFNSLTAEEQDHVREVLTDALGEVA